MNHRLFLLLLAVAVMATGALSGPVAQGVSAGTSASAPRRRSQSLLTSTATQPLRHLGLFAEWRHGDLLLAGPEPRSTGRPEPSAVEVAGGFTFQHHHLDRQLPGNSWAQTALADVDKDGRLDYITGQTRGPILWYRQESPDRWVRHTLGTHSPSDVGGAAFDVDGDGWVDFVAGGAWYRNPGRPRTELFERLVFDRDLAAVHDLVVADVDRDGRPDILTMSDKNNLRWYRIPRDPRQPWERRDIGPGVHAGIGVGDIDGDGDLDVARSNLWFENADGRGTRWVTHENIPFGNPNKPYPLGTHCVALDLDRDGDTDLVMTENEIKAGRIGWLENLDGRGGGWKLHELPKGDPAARGAYHSLVVADFDNDGDPDVFSCEMEGIPGDQPPRWFIWENRDGKGGSFAEHVILDANLGGHLVVAGDVDKDGDLDLIGKLWRPRKDNANEGRNHVDLLENRLVVKAVSTPPSAARAPASSSVRTDTGATTYFPPPESQGGWRKIETRDDIRRLAGMDPQKLDELREWLLKSDERDFAAVVIRNGCIVLEVERGNSARTDARRVASVSKAVCATVLAIASEWSRQGKTPRQMNLDDPAFDFIPWAQPLSDPRKARITVKQLLNHTSGICPEATGAPNDGSWKYILGHTGDPRTAKLAFDPGAGCGYSTHALAHAALVCETVTGKPYDQFAIEALFQPLGIEHWWFQYHDGGGKIGRHPSHGLGLPARDLARIAYCMLREGRWGGRQVIPKRFVQETAAPTHGVTTPELRWKLNPQVFSHGWELPARHTAESGRSGAGIPADARSKPGSGGQLIAFVPSLDLIITRQTGASGPWEYEEYLRRACATVLTTQLGIP